MSLPLRDPHINIPPSYTPTGAMTVLSINVQIRKVQLNATNYLTPFDSER